MNEKPIESFSRTELLAILARHDQEYAKRGPGKADCVNRLHALGITTASLEPGK
jgi:hypothetical protein